MFSKEQIETLNQELENSRIKSREKGNVSLSYIEGFDVIDTANLIFGFGNWSYLISKLEQVSQEQNHNQNFVVCYKAVVKLIVKDENHTKSIFRQDVGFGTGVSKTLADAHENAGKEAVTDSLKRAMRSFGNQFGNSLYDKTRNHQNSPQMQNSNYQQNQNYNQKPTQNNQQQQPYQNGNVNNRNINNVNQKPIQHNPQQQHSFQNNQSFDQYEYQPLFNLGLNIIEQNGFLIVTGDDIFSKKDSIKACGFRFDSKSKTWYKPIEQGVA
jgi:DNA repair and recombination protein RAD52